MMNRDTRQQPSREIVLHSEALTPSFGAATLTNCEREQIHLAGSIQPHGALMMLREPELTIQQASENLLEFLSLRSDQVIGRGLGELAPELDEAVRSLLEERLEDMPFAVRAFLEPVGPLDVLVHRPPSGGLLVELERSGPPVSLAGSVDAGLRSIVGATTLQGLCDEAAWVFRELSGYDRVMVYRFDGDGNGEVIAEQRRADLEALLGNRYPASDIPQIARKLYVRNRVRVLVDVNYVPAAIRPRRLPNDDREIDMSMSVLRSPSPIHVQYLKNMGVSATLVVSLMVDGRLWGLISCHHYAPREVHFEARTVCELLAEAVATRIAALESFVQSQVELSVRRLERRVIDSIAREGDWRVALFDGSRAILTPVGAVGAALLYEDQCLSVGDVPSTQKLREIGQWLDDQALLGVPRSPVFATSALSTDAPRFASIIDVASGMVAATISTAPGEYLLWFRPEQVRTVVWGGDPTKPMEVGNDPMTLSPRRSFAQWHQRVEGTSAAWSAVELTAARLIGETVSDVILQFRAVRMLVAEEQLRHVTRGVAESDEPVLIADETGRLMLVNPAFRRLLPQGVEPPYHFDHLPELFHEPRDVRRRLGDLRLAQRAWRGEVLLRVGDDGDQPLLVRADPVLSAPDRVLGYVILFTDLTDRKMAENARRAFQAGIAEGQRVASARLETQAGMAARNLLASLLENAQLAAMEITDGVDALGIAHRLESVRASVQRAAEMMERLIRHADRLD